MDSITKIIAINTLAIMLNACGGGTGTGGVDESSPATSSTPSNTTSSGNQQNITANFIAVKPALNTCIGCHKTAGIASDTNLILNPSDDNATISALKTYSANFSRSALLSKTVGIPFHAGGAVFINRNSEPYKNFEILLNSFQITSNTANTPATPTPNVPASPTNPAISAADNLNRLVIQAKCISCHTTSGAAQNTALIFRSGLSSADGRYNGNQVSAFPAVRTNGQQVLLDKPRGLLNHGGGSILALGSSEYTLLANFIGVTPSVPTTPNAPTTPVNNANYTLESASETYRRASLYLTGNIPGRSKVLSLQGSDDATLRAEILNLMSGNGFKEFLKNGANARLNSRHLLTSDAGAAFYNKYYLKNASRQEGRRIVRRDLAEEPLEIIANVVMNDRPYSEILTANYTMVGQYTDESYNTGLNLSPGQWREAQNRGQDVKTRATFYRDATGASRVSSFPHAGVLSTWSYLSKYGTTATNRNRARASWTLYHFLGFDIEKSVSRTISISDVSDESNPTLNNPACTVCHQTLDPIAGAFKFFHERIGYKAWGTDSLDSRYRRRNPGVDWYQDMLPAGFNNMAVNGGDPLQWLAQRIVEDSRFATGAVKFWWFAVFGEDVLGSDAPRIQFDTQQTLIAALANNFRQNLNLKSLLANMMMSDNFRAAMKTDANQADNTVKINMGARRLLTGTELKNKTTSLTGITWGNTRPRLEGEYKLLYGGTDDVTVEKRATNLSSIMFRVAERHANEISCAAVVYDFSLNKNRRKLFTQVERRTLDEPSIRNQIVVLYERMHNRLVSSSSTEVNRAYQLFLDLRQARINAGGGTRVNSITRCDNRIGGSLDDASYVLTPWRGLLIALMSDPDYLYE